MYFISKPSTKRIDEFVKAQSRLDFSYRSVAATRNGDHPSGFVVDHHGIQLGSGQATFELAQQALCAWQHFRFSWVQIHRPETKPQPGQTVAILARAAGLWVLNACRVVYVLDEYDPVRRFAFAYGTLPDHAEAGEERFQVTWREEDDSIWYDILAYSRPNQWFSRLAYPYVRSKQRQFARDSRRAMQTAVGERRGA